MLSGDIFLLFVVNIFVLLHTQKYVSSLGFTQKIRKGMGTPELKFTYNAPPDEWFEQKLDHFVPKNTKTWKQRYGTNQDFHKPGGPVFLMITGEWRSNPSWLVYGEWIRNAERLNALCFQLEHRFYGDSQPTKNTSLDNLEYLTSEQAMGDIAYFITGMNSKYKLPSNTKWIAFGGSYAGTLAAWVRMKYPFLIYGAVSSSGPLLALVDFYQYHEVVRDGLRTHSEECVSEVKIANKQISDLLQREDGRSYLEKSFKLCDKIDVNNKKDIQNLFLSLSDNVAEIVQYNRGYRNITTLCDIMTSGKENQNTISVQKYAEFNSLMLAYAGEICLDFKYDKLIKYYSNVKWDGISYGRQWIYQTCTEFGFYQTSSIKSDLYGGQFPLELYINMCIDLFGSSFNEKFLDSAVERTNILNGELSINVGNIVFIHGSIDPWHTLGITRSHADKPYNTIFINGTAHCADMYTATCSDLPQLNSSRMQISSLLDRWILE